MKTTKLSRQNSPLPDWYVARYQGYPRKAEQVGRDSRALRAPLSRLKLVPDISSLISLDII